jgi:D-alanine transaminase
VQPPEPIANLDGRLLPLAEAQVPALDRGFLFGDGIYEVLRVYAGRPWLEEAHFRRLERSLREVRIEKIDLDRLRRRMRETIAAGPFEEAIVYIQITRGSAPRAHVFPAAATPLEFLFVQAFVDPYLDMRECGANVITRPDLRWGRCDIKSVNLLGNVLMAQEAEEAGCKEALLYLPDGTLTEGTHTSLMGVVQGTLVSAPNGSGILPGTTRDLVVREAGRMGVSFREQPLRRQNLDRVDELFLTGTTAEVLPIARVDGRPIRDGRPGPVTGMLQKAYAEIVAAFRSAG